MIVLVDSNVFFDVVEKRKPHYPASNQMLHLCRRRELSGSVAFHTVANLYYQYGKAVLPFIRERVLVDFAVHGASASVIADTLRCGIKDFEDALQSASAQTAGAAFIVTRNVKDFRLSKVPALSPVDFLKRFRPST